MTPRNEEAASAPATRASSLTLPLFLGIALIVTALAVVSVKHENRQLTTEIERLRMEHDRLDTEWTQLQLEEAALAHHGRIESLAREQLGMSEPRDYVVVAPARANNGARP